MQISTLNYSEINEEFRIDAEFYRKEILNAISLLDIMRTDKLENLVNFVVGPFGSTVTVDKYVQKSNYRYIRNKDINDFVIKENDPALIPENIYNLLTQFHVKEKDLLITVVGTLGKVAISQKKDTKSIFSCKSTILRTKKINPYYLLAYLNSKIGKLFSLRGTRGAIQEGLNLFDLKEIKVFLAKNGFQVLIEKILKTAFSKSENAYSYFQQAQSLLLSELGLENWKPKHKLSFFKNYSDAKISGRIDAKYFQPIYFNTEKLLKEKFKAKLIGEYDFLDITTGQYTNSYVSKNEGNPYIRGTDLFNASVNTDNLVYISKSNQVFSKKAIEGDVVVTRVGTIGISSRIPKECDDSTISDNLIRIRIKDQQKLNSYYLALYLNTELGKNFMIRASRGSVQQRLNQETLKEIILPIININKQKEIANIISHSQNQQNKSKSLIEIAKKSVEIAIEKDEEIAEKWINSELNKLGVKLNA